MKLSELYSRVVETTGLEVLTLESLNAAIANCFADLTSRGYREFEEQTILNTAVTLFNKNFAAITLPTGVRKIVYCRVYFTDQASVAFRVPLGNPYVESLARDGYFSSDLIRLGKKVIYYTKGESLMLEWLGSHEIQQIILGTYKRLIPPVLTSDTITNDSDLSSVNIEIRDEFKDALVLYTSYFYINRELRDTERTQLALNQYKYYVEDILHELSEEDQFDEDDNSVVIE